MIVSVVWLSVKPDSAVSDPWRVLSSVSRPFSIPWLDNISGTIQRHGEEGVHTSSPCPCSSGPYCRWNTGLTWIQPDGVDDTWPKCLAPLSFSHRACRAP